MSIDTDSATAFAAGHARLLDRRRLELLLGHGDVAATAAALDAYRNADGGYGHGLEPDLRCAESQPAGALHAFEVMAEIAPHASARALALCDWLAGATLSDGGLPFALPISDPAGVAPFWANADPAISSLQITAYVAGAAHEVAARDPAVAAHPWLAGATSYCAGAIEALDEAPHALVIAASLRFVAAARAALADAPRLVARLGRFVPADGRLGVAGGREDESVGPLDLAPDPRSPARELFAEEAVRADVERLARGQREDGGWTVDFASYSPAAELEWRGYATVRAISVLRANGAG